MRAEYDIMYQTADNYGRHRNRVRLRLSKQAVVYILYILVGRALASASFRLGYTDACVPHIGVACHASTFKS